MVQNDTISCNRCTSLFKYTVHTQRKHTDSWICKDAMIKSANNLNKRWGWLSVLTWLNFHTAGTTKITLYQKKKGSKLDFVRHWQTEHQIHLKAQTEKLRKVISRGQVDRHTFTELTVQSYRITQVGRDQPGSSSPTPDSTVYHPNWNPMSESGAPTLPELQHVRAVLTALGSLLHAHHPLAQPLSGCHTHMR